MCREKRPKGSRHKLLSVATPARTMTVQDPPTALRCTGLHQAWWGSQTRWSCSFWLVQGVVRGLRLRSRGLGTSGFPQSSTRQCTPRTSASCAMASAKGSTSCKPSSVTRSLAPIRDDTWDYFQRNSTDAVDSRNIAGMGHWIVNEGRAVMITHVSRPTVSSADMTWGTSPRIPSEKGTRSLLPTSRRVTFMVYLLWLRVPSRDEELETFGVLQVSVRFSELLTVWRCHFVEVTLFLNPDSAGTFLLGLLAAVTEFRYQTFYVAESSPALQERLDVHAHVYV